MAKTAKTETTITLKEIRPIQFSVEIEGTSDIVLNKMDNVTRDILTNPDNAKVILERANPWERLITSVHWLEGDPEEFTEETYHEWIETKTPCFTAFGFKQSCCDAVYRYEIDKNKTKYAATTNILVSNNLIPITYAEHYLDEKLMQPHKGKPVLSKLHRFTGWKAIVPMETIDTVYNIDTHINIINCAGFGLGIGSGRSSGYGRYRVTGIK